MLEHYLKTTYQKILINPFIKSFAKFLSPNGATGLACLTGISAAFALIYSYLILAVVLLLISGYFDTLDGPLARYKKKPLAKGTALDIISDRIVEVATVLGLYGVAPHNRGWLALGMLGSILICVTMFLIVGIFAKNETSKGFYYSPGLIERAEAFLFFIAMMLAPVYFNILASTFIFLVLLTAYFHYYQFNKQFREYQLVIE